MPLIVVAVVFGERRPPKLINEAVNWLTHHSRTRSYIRPSGRLGDYCLGGMGIMRAGSNRVAYVAAVGADGPFARQAVDRPAIPKFVTKLSVVVLQILGLWGLNVAGVWAVDAAALPVPGNLLGMVALYVLLALGVVKVSWFDTTGSFLIKHLAFFFIPITVGLMESGRLLAQHGIAIVVTLIASAAVGIVLSGLVSQFLLGEPWRPGGSS
jgi:holin-like protein